MRSGPLWRSFLLKELEDLEDLYQSAAAALKRVSVTHELVPSQLVAELEPGFRAAGFRPEVRLPGELERILVVRLDRIGDFVLMSPFLRELRRGRPGAQITLVVRPVVEALARRCPYVNEVLTLDLAEPQLTGQGLMRTLTFAREQLWPRRFSLAFCPRCSLSVVVDASLAWLSGAQQRVGFSANITGNTSQVSQQLMVGDAFLTRVLHIPALPMQELEHNLLLLRALGLPVQDERLEVWYDRQDAAEAARLCSGIGESENRRLVAVGIGASEPRKTYPAELLIRALAALTPQCDFVLLGGPGEQAAGEQIVSALPAGTVRSLAGQTTLPQTEAVIARCALYIGNDTGMLHMAAALRRPVVEISCDLPVPPELDYLRQPVRFAPWQVPSILLHPEQALAPCDAQVSPVGCLANEPHCITQIRPDQVAEAARSLLAIRF